MKNHPKSFKIMKCIHKVSIHIVFPVNVYKFVLTRMKMIYQCLKKPDIEKLLINTLFMSAQSNYHTQVFVRVHNLHMNVSPFHFDM